MGGVLVVAVTRGSGGAASHRMWIFRPRTAASSADGLEGNATYVEPGGEREQITFQDLTTE